MVFGEGFQLANPMLNFLVLLMEGVNLLGNIIKCRCVRRLCTVSYTHLDVYKRQSLPPSGGKLVW